MHASAHKTENSKVQTRQGRGRKSNMFHWSIEAYTSPATLLRSAVGAAGMGLGGLSQGKYRLVPPTSKYTGHESGVNSAKCSYFDRVCGQSL